MRWPLRLAVVILALSLAGCGTPRVAVFDPATAPQDSQAGSVIAIRRIARTWGRIDLDLALDASATAQVYQPIVPQVTAVTLVQAGSAPSRTTTGRDGRAQRATGPRTHAPAQITRLPDDPAIVFRVSFDAAGIDDAGDLVLVVTGALFDHPLRWCLAVPPPRVPDAAASE